MEELKVHEPAHDQRKFMGLSFILITRAQDSIYKRDSTLDQPRGNDDSPNITRHSTGPVEGPKFDDVSRQSQVLAVQILPRDS